MKTDLDTLRLFNEKVNRLERSGFASRFDSETPNVTAEFRDVSFHQVDGARFELTGRVVSTFDGLDADQIDAFVLTYRMFTQRNDRISIASVAKIYAQAWMPSEARERFNDARQQVNEYLNSNTTLIDGQHAISRCELVDVFLYGGLAHSDTAKERTFRAWTVDGGVAGFFWAEFIVTLKDMLGYMRYFRDLNTAVIHNLTD